jgi:putative transposase
VIFAWVEERKAERPVALLCRVLGVSRSGFYAWRTRPPSAAEHRRGELTEQVQQIHHAVKGRYGSPRVNAEYARRGFAMVDERMRVYRTKYLTDQPPAFFKEVRDAVNKMDPLKRLREKVQGR